MFKEKLQQIITRMKSDKLNLRHYWNRGQLQSLEIWRQKEGWKKPCVATTCLKFFRANPRGYRGFEQLHAGTEHHGGSSSCNPPAGGLSLWYGYLVDGWQENYIAYLYFLTCPWRNPTMLMVLYNWIQFRGFPTAYVTVFGDGFFI